LREYINEWGMGCGEWEEPVEEKNEQAACGEGYKIMGISFCIPRERQK